MKTVKTLFVILAACSAIFALIGCNKGVGPPAPNTAAKHEGKK